MSDPAALHALAARLEAATEGGRELDASVWTALGLGEAQWPTPFAFDGETWGYVKDGRWQRVPLVSASLDAAVALCEAVLPDWVIEMQIRPEGVHYVALHEFPLPCRRIPPKPPWMVSGPTPAFALVRAIVAAKLAEACTPSSP